MLPEPHRRDAADGGAAEVAEDVAEEVLHDQHVEVTGAQHQRLGRGVGVEVLGLDVGVVRGDLDEDLAEKAHGCAARCSCRRR